MTASENESHLDDLLNHLKCETGISSVPPRTPISTLAITKREPLNLELPSDAHLKLLTRDASNIPFLYAFRKLIMGRRDALMEVLLGSRKTFNYETGYNFNEPGKREFRAWCDENAIDIIQHMRLVFWEKRSERYESSEPSKRQELAQIFMSEILECHRVVVTLEQLGIRRANENDRWEEREKNITSEMSREEWLKLFDHIDRLMDVLEKEKVKLRREKKYMLAPPNHRTPRSESPWGKQPLPRWGVEIRETEVSVEELKEIAELRVGRLNRLRNEVELLAGKVKYLAEEEEIKFQSGRLSISYYHSHRRRHIARLMNLDEPNAVKEAKEFLKKRVA